MEIDPKRENTWRLLGLRYMNLKEYDKAIAACQKAVEINPKDAWSWAYLGLVYSSANLDEKAYEAYNKAVEINPNIERIKKNRDSLAKKLNKN